MHGSEPCSLANNNELTRDVLSRPPTAMQAMQGSTGDARFAWASHAGSYDKKTDLGATETGAHFASFN